MTGRRSGTIVPRGEGKYLIRWYVGRDPETGKRKYGSKTVEGTFTRAKNALAKETTSVVAGDYVTPTKQTLGEFLVSWLDTVVAIKVEASTLKSYKARVHTDLIERIGALKLTAVTEEIIQKLYATLLEEGHSPRTVQYTHTLLNGALKKAVSRRLLRENPCTGVELPLQRHTEMQVWTAEEVNQFLKATAGTRDYALWFTLLHTGVRPGEAFGLRWEDLDGNTLSIRRAIADGEKKGTYEVKGPKTKKGERTISVSDDLLVVLRAHGKAQKEEILAAGPAYNRDDYVFADPQGHHETLIPARGRWKTAMRRAKVKEIRLYDCRHTHATLLLKAGVNPKVVSERLGHASVVITLDTYSHVLPDMQDEAVERLGIILKAAQ